MTRPAAVRWQDDPAHFRRPTRRGFLQVGAIAAVLAGHPETAGRDELVIGQRTTVSTWRRR